MDQNNNDEKGKGERREFDSTHSTAQHSREAFHTLILTLSSEAIEPYIAVA